MIKTAKTFLIAAFLVSFSITGAFAQESGDSPAKTGMSVEDTVKASGGPLQGPGMPPGARDQALRGEKDKAIREFQKAVRDAERKFNADQKAASKLPAEERKAAIQKGAEEMKASIKDAEAKKDTVLEKLGHRRKKPPQHRERAKKDINKGQINGEQKGAEQTKGLLTDDTKSPSEQQKK